MSEETPKGPRPTQRGVPALEQEPRIDQPIKYLIHVVAELNRGHVVTVHPSLHRIGMPEFVTGFDSSIKNICIIRFRSWCKISTCFSSGSNNTTTR